MTLHRAAPLDGLSQDARYFVGVHGVRLEPRPLEKYRAAWLERGVPAEQIDRSISFESRWGGLALPPAPAYEGGPRWFAGDRPEGSAEGGWRFVAGDQRCSVPFSFWIGPHDEFGICGPRWTPLHAGIEGWIESVALAHHAALFARKITKLRGADADGLDLSGFDQVPEVRGLADTWWTRPTCYIAVFRGEAAAHKGESRHAPKTQAIVYEGLPSRLYGS